MKATKIKVIPSMKEEGQQVVELYSVEPPVVYGHGEASYVVVSAVNNMFANETYIFPSDSDGNIIDWTELEGSHQDGMDIPRAVADFEALYS